MNRRFGIATVSVLLLSAGVARAANTGFYIGGSIGNSNQHFDADTFSVHGSDTGYQVAAGFRPLGVLAGELDYISLGRASAGQDYADTDAIGAFALGFLPIPLVDVYGRLGAVEWRTDANSPTFGFHRTGTNLAYGAGAGTSWGSLGVRAEYTHYDVAHSRDLGLTSIGVTWTFL